MVWTVLGGGLGEKKCQWRGMLGLREARAIVLVGQRAGMGCWEGATGCLEGGGPRAARQEPTEPGPATRVS